VEQLCPLIAASHTDSATSWRFCGFVGMFAHCAATGFMREAGRCVQQAPMDIPYPEGHERACRNRTHINHTAILHTLTPIQEPCRR